MSNIYDQVAGLAKDATLEEVTATLNSGASFSVEGEDSPVIAKQSIDAVAALFANKHVSSSELTTQAKSHPASEISAGMYSVEGFDQYDLSPMAISVAANAAGIEESAFMTSAFPIINTTKPTIELRVNNVEVYSLVSREGNDLKSENRRSLSRAYLEPEILDSDDLKLVPAIVTGAGDNSALFADSNYGAAKEESVGGNTVNTNYLKPGQNFNVFKNSELPGVLSSQFNSLDMLNPNLRVTALRLGFTDPNGGSAIHEGFDFEIGSTNPAVFTKAAEGDEYQLALNKSMSLVIDPTTQTNTGVDSTILQHLRDSNATAEFKVQLSGSANLRTSEVVVYINDVKLNKVYQGGAEVAATETVYTDLVAILNGLDVMGVVGYKINPTHSNSAIRQFGTIVGSRAYHKTYRVGPQAPITAFTHNNSAAGGGSEAVNRTNAASIAETQRGRLHTGALRALSAFNDFLSANKDAVNNAEDATTEFGISGVIIKPTYVTQEVDLTGVEVRTEKGRYDDVAARFINTVITTIQSMYMKGNVGPIMSKYFKGQKPVFSATASARMVDFLGRSDRIDNTRIKTDDFEVQFISDNANIVDGKVFIYLSNYDAAEGVYLTPGVTAVMGTPVRRSDNMTIAGANGVKVDMLQPYYEFINVTPLMGLVTYAQGDLDELFNSA